MNSSRSPNFLQEKTEKDNLLIKKLHDPEYLYGLQYHSYENFIEKSIDKTLEEFSKKGFYRVISDEKTYEYVLKFGKTKVRAKKGSLPEDHENVSILSSRQANGYLSLDVPIGVSRMCEGKEEIVVHPRAYRLCDIPLLYNSRYDTSLGSSRNKYPYFLINGIIKILVNQIIHCGLVPRITVKSSSDGKTVEKVSYGIMRNKSYEEYAYQFPSLVLTRGKNTYNLFDILRTLEVSVEEIMSQALPGSEVQILGLVESSYVESSEEQVLNRLKETLGLQEDSSKEKLVETLVSQLGFEGLQNSKVLIRGGLKVLFELIARGKESELFMDHMKYKKVLSCGQVLHSSFVEGLQELMNRVKTPLIKALTSRNPQKSQSLLLCIIRPEIITRAMRKVITTSSETTQTVNRPFTPVNQNDGIAELRKLVTPLNKTLSHDNYRQFNPSEYGRICPSHTPHSRSTGLVETLALGAKVTLNLTPQEEKEVKAILDQLCIKNTRGPGDTRITRDGEILGYSTRTVEELVTYVKKARGPLEIGVTKGKDSVSITSTAGRVVKLVLNVSNGKVPYYSLKNSVIESSSLSKLVKKGYLRFIDAQEEQASKIAIALEECGAKDDYYYPGGELNYSYIMGYIPAANNNTGTRASLTLRFIAQALTEKPLTQTYPTSSNKSEYLVRAESSLVKGPHEKLYPDRLGQNLLTVISSYKDYTCEDAVTMNRNSVQRGMLDYLCYKRQKSKIIPDEKGVYHLWTQDDRLVEGFPKTTSRFDKGEPFISTINSEGRPHTEIASPGKDYRIIEVSLDKIKKELKVEVVSKKYRNITIGEKIGTRQGQKGIVGGLIKECNLPAILGKPYCAGLLMSPNVFSSRMTIGPLSEMLLSKASGLLGQSITQEVIEPNCLKPLEWAGDVLERFGYSKDGIEKPIYYGCRSQGFFTGFLKVFLLEHHSIDKFHRRRRGSIDVLTRQPSGGGKKSVGRGLRFGEMERDAVVAHGASHLLKERLTPDSTEVLVCSQCHVIVNEDHRFEGADFCGCCKGTDLVVVRIPYAFLVLSRTLRGASIQTCMVPQNVSILEEEDTTTEPTKDSTQQNEL